MGNALMVANRRDATAIVVPVEVTLRAIAESDLPQVADAYHRTYQGTSDEMTSDDAREDLEAAWRGDYGRWLLDASIGAWVDGELVGAVLTTVDPPWDDVPRGPFIIDLFVLPAARRRGVGKALVETAWGVVSSVIRLRVDDTAEPARRLYEGLGFVYTGPLTD